MKLSTLHEASYVGDNRFRVLERVFNEVKRNVPNATINDIAAFVASMWAEHIHSDYDVPQLFELVMSGLPKLQDNPQAINDGLKIYFDEETGEDLDELIENAIEYVRDRRK